MSLGADLSHLSMNKIYIDGSHCPYLRCGGWAFHITGFRHSNFMFSGPIQNAKTAYHCESYALMHALRHIDEHEHKLEFLAEPFIIVTDNQNLVARVNRENEYLLQVNYHRPEPWDRIHQLMLDLGPLRLKAKWKSFKGDSFGKAVHVAAKSNMITTRDLIQQKYAEAEDKEALHNS